MGAAETTGARGWRVSDARLATTIRSFGLDAEGWSVAEPWLDLRDARAEIARLTTALAASEARVVELERQVAEAERAGMERAVLRLESSASDLDQIADQARLWNRVADAGKIAETLRREIRAIRAAMPTAAAKEG